MQFNTVAYICFLAMVLLLYRLASHRTQNRLLLLASYVFYGSWDWRFLLLIIVSTLTDYTIALRLARTSSPRTRRLLVTLSLAVNLGILFVFKYLDFFLASTELLLQNLGFEAHLPSLRLVLPVGISFYTFQTLAYTINVYRGRVRPCPSLEDFALYVAFFPQLVAGPIERAERLLPQIRGPRDPIDLDGLGEGTLLIVRGLIKKVVLADQAATLVNRVFLDPLDFSGPAAALATLAFSIQIYGDFSGYTDIARGSARLFGIELMENFRQPYLARNITEFWRRWHISLSTWLRDYLYIPLGGNRRGTARTYVNLMIVMLLGGLWHGAGWNFVIWGGLHGLMLVLHRSYRQDSGDSPLALKDFPWVVANFVFVCFCWIFFRADTASQAWLIIRRIATMAPGDLPIQVLVLPPLVVLMLLLDLASRGLPHWMPRPEDLPAPLRGCVHGAALVALYVFWDASQQPFVYFQF